MSSKTAVYIKPIETDQLLSETSSTLVNKMTSHYNKKPQRYSARSSWKRDVITSIYQRIAPIYQMQEKGTLEISMQVEIHQ